MILLKSNGHKKPTLKAINVALQIHSCSNNPIVKLESCDMCHIYVWVAPHRHSIHYTVEAHSMTMFGHSSLPKVIMNTINFL